MNGAEFSEPEPSEAETPDAVRRARAAIERLTRRIPDFPEPGVQFADVTPVFADSQGLAAIVDGLVAIGCGDRPPSDDQPSIELVAGIDARGFLIGGAVALRLGVGVLAVRKSGKLPPPVRRRDYTLEYGTASLEVPAEGIDVAGRRVLIVDDVLATGGTVLAAAGLLSDVGAEVVAVATIVELAALGGRAAVAARLGPTVLVNALCSE